MVAKNSILVLTFMLGALMTIGLALTTSKSVWAATKFCNFDSDIGGPCFGTNSDDTIAGDSHENHIFGCGGNDVISGSFGNDFTVGDQVTTSGCPPGGQPGADKITAGPGDDEVYHAESGAASTAPDGHRDLIDCGPGDHDEAWINFSVDNDVALNCERIFAG